MLIKTTLITCNVNFTYTNFNLFDISKISKLLLKKSEQCLLLVDNATFVTNRLTTRRTTGVTELLVTAKNGEDYPITIFDNE